LKNKAFYSPGFQHGRRVTKVYGICTAEQQAGKDRRKAGKLHKLEKSCPKIEGSFFKERQSLGLVAVLLLPHEAENATQKKIASLQGRWKM